MNLNTLMHTRNIYKDNPPDFKDLAVKYPYFKSHSRENTNGRVVIDFKNPEALRALLYALLENDFDIKIEIPLDRLIPTLPLRLNYIHWIEDLVKCLDDDTGTAVTGIDIGSGASCIYPLLGAKLNGWRFLATEVDESSARYAKDNVKMNELHDNITVQLVTPDMYLVQPLQEDKLKKATFCMCNPPFFSSEDDAVLGGSRTDKRAVPISVSTGSTNETVTRGGEVEFVKGIIDDSLKLQQNVSWYSSMLGKKSSMKAVTAYLKEVKVPTVVTTQFCQGKTMRWGVAWTFIPGLTVDTVMSPPAKKQKKENKPLSFMIPADCSNLPCHEGCSRFEDTVKWMDNILGDLKVTVEQSHQGNKFCQWQCSASEITWANQRQKRRKLKHESQNISLGNRDDKINTGSQQNQTSGKSSDENEHDTKPKDLKEEKERIDKECESTNDGSPLCTFQVRVESNDNMHVEVQCIRAGNKNYVYQFYQFLQNKLERGL